MIDVDEDNQINQSRGQSRINRIRSRQESAFEPIKMGPLHETVTWYKSCPAGWHATHWDIQNKEKSRLAG